MITTRSRQSTLAVPRFFAYWLLGWVITAVAAAEEPSKLTEQWQQTIKPFLKQYCADCHSGENAESGINFDKYQRDDQLVDERARWNQILGIIKIGAMPPADHDPQPSKELRQQVAQWLHRRINTVDCDLIQNPGRVVMRRLNNTEYDNSLRDLLGINFAPSVAAGFPGDEVGDGFDNQGGVLSISQMLLEKYMQAAELVATRALDNPPGLEHRATDLPKLYLGDRYSFQLLFGQGQYEIKPRLQFLINQDDTAQVDLLVDNQVKESFTVGKRRKSFRVDLELSAGSHEVTLRFVSDSAAEKKDKVRRVDIESVSVKGPPTASESYQKIVKVLPGQETPADKAAQENLVPILRRAYRREPTPEDIQRIMTLVRMALDGGMPFERAMGVGLQAILVSPHFLFRVEQDSTGQQVDSYALASRLSYFLWASLPDDQLLDLASQDRLSDPGVVSQQVQRMLSDPRSQAIVQRFFGQYLGLGNLRDVSPDPERFPLWNDRLRSALRQETEMYCQEMLSKNLSLDTLLQGDFTFVNPRLAELYGVTFDGVDPAELFQQGPGYNLDQGRRRDGLYAQEDRWLRVSMPPNRRGVLTQGSILTLTSNPTATSPVKRGKWVMETILGDPPPAAPPNVPAFEETQKEHEKLTLRQQFAIHRANPSCASCHDVMDPLGLGFEHFNAIGQWRETDADLPVDAGGELADGRSFNGALELVTLLATDKPKIYRFFAEKLLTYALGRGLEPYDNCAVDAIMESAEQDDYTIGSFIQAVVVSDPFTLRAPDSRDSLSGLP